MNDQLGSGIAQQLAPVLYSDIKTWIASLGHRVIKVFHKASIKKFETLSDLLNAIKGNEIKIGEQVRIKVIPAPFGPFLRHHFLTTIVGPHTGLRIGPPLLSPNPIMGLMAQATSHLMPVGLYPPITDDVNQACLYPADTPACGFIGVIPGVNDLVPYLFALIASRFTPYYGLPCWVVGTARYVDASTLISAGYSPEDHEVIRQIGNVWFLDVTDDDAKVEPISDILTEGLWGGLYASGHLEIASGELKIQSVVNSFKNAFDAEGFETHVSQNQAGRKEIALFAKGIRSTIDTISPFYSIHMDAEITRDFGTYRKVFDSVTNGLLSNLREACNEESVELVNEFDLDFSYTNSTNAYTVLKSVGAETIRDPIAVAIRDWHRLRGA